MYKLSSGQLSWLAARLTPMLVFFLLLGSSYHRCAMAWPMNSVVTALLLWIPSIWHALVGT